MQNAAEDIIRNADEFDKEAFGNGDEIIEKHYWKIHRLACLYANLRQYGANEKPKGTQPLGPDDFRCFGCGHVIKREDNQCSLCGWTWK